MSPTYLYAHLDGARIGSEMSMRHCSLFALVPVVMRTNLGVRLLAKVGVVACSLKSLTVNVESMADHLGDKAHTRQC
jgi:hypothetical protein